MLKGMKEHLHINCLSSCLANILVFGNSHESFTEYFALPFGFDPYAV